MELVGRYTREDVPKELLSLPIVDRALRLEVMNAGPMAGINLSPAEAAKQGLMKNHWRYFVFIRGSNDKVVGVAFGFNPDDTPSVESNVAQYAANSRGSWSDNDRFSFYGSEGKPDNLEKPGYSPVEVKKPPLLDDKPLAPSNKGSRFKPVIWDDATSANVVYAPSSISSTDPAIVINQHIEGKPRPGIFSVKVVGRDSTSTNAFVVFKLDLLKDLTLGDLFAELDTLQMVPFFFRKIGFAIFGCRDFIFNSVAHFIAKEYTSGFVTDEEKHIFDLISWRYTHATDDADDIITLESNPDVRCVKNKVDRAVWPDAFVAYIDDEGRVEFNQDA